MVFGGDPNPQFVTLYHLWNLKKKKKRSLPLVPRWVSTRVRSVQKPCVLAATHTRVYKIMYQSF